MNPDRILTAQRVLALFVLLATTAGAPTRMSGPAVKVACVGDSITFGSGLPDRAHTTYPLLLGHLLSDGFEVRNFGVSGATMLARGNKPWRDTALAKDALEWKPDIVVIKLGTNDSKRMNWDRHAGDFVSDACALIRRFREANEKARVFLCTPAPAWTEGDSIDRVRIAKEIVPAIHDVADRTDCEVIDLHTALIDRKSWFPDGVHPNPHGAEAIARSVATALESARGTEPRESSFCTRAQPGVEWRGGPAGWNGGTWWGQHAAINALGAANPDLDVVFLGDSITQSWTGSADRLARADGARCFDRFYGRRKAASFGISGDRTEHLLWRIEHGNFDAIDPRLVVLMIGVNNINHGDSGAATADGIEAVVRKLRTREPQADILLLGCFPTNKIGSRARRESEILHERIAPLGELSRVRYLDIRSLFLQDDGTLDPRTMRSDGVHITAAGYEAWAAAIEPVVTELLSREE